MEIRFSNSNRIYIKNTTNTAVKILIAPNKDWIMGDVVFMVAKAVYTFGGSAAVETAAEVTAKEVAKSALKSAIQGGIITVKNLYSVYKVYSKIKKLSKLKTAVSQDQLKTQEAVIEKMFDSGGVTVKPGECIMINEKSLADGIKGVIRYLTPALYAIQTDTDLSKEIDDLDKALSNGRDKSLGDLVEQVSNVLSLMNPSTFASILSSVSDLTLFVTTSDFNKFTAFNTNSDHSWIIRENDIVRAKYGTTTTEDPGEGRQLFSQTLGDAMKNDDYLEPFQSLDVATSNYNIIGELEIPKIPQMEGSSSSDDDGFFDKVGHALDNAGAFVANVAGGLVNTATTAVEGVVNFPKTVGSAPYKLIYQPDGNLVLYRISGDVPTPKWATNTDHQPAFRTVMQADGNFVVYAAEGKPIWALWRDPKPKYRGASIQLDDISGNINYILQGASEPEFCINELSCRKLGDTFFPILKDNE